MKTKEKLININVMKIVHTKVREPVNLVIFLQKAALIPAGVL